MAQTHAFMKVGNHSNNFDHLAKVLSRFLKG